MLYRSALSLLSRSSKVDVTHLSTLRNALIACELTHRSIPSSISLSLSLAHLPCIPVLFSVVATSYCIVCAQCALQQLSSDLSVEFICLPSWSKLFLSVAFGCLHVCNSATFTRRVCLTLNRPLVTPAYVVCVCVCVSVWIDMTKSCAIQ